MSSTNTWIKLSFGLAFTMCWITVKTGNVLWTIIPFSAWWRLVPRCSGCGSEKRKRQVRTAVSTRRCSAKVILGWIRPPETVNCLLLITYYTNTPTLFDIVRSAAPVKRRTSRLHPSLNANSTFDTHYSVLFFSTFPGYLREFFRSHTTQRLVIIGSFASFFVPSLFDTMQDFIFKRLLDATKDDAGKNIN